MTILFYSVSARKNELSKTLGTATSLTGTLREPVSLTDPEILIESATVPAYNYAYIADFGRYYFVRNVISVSNVIVEFILEVDAMASVKSQIGGSSEYVLRSASNYDGLISDTVYRCSVHIH